MSLEEAYVKRYKMRLMGTGGATTVTTIPPLVVQKESKKRGLTIAEFIKRFVVEAAFNNFEGIHYTFVEAVPKTKNPVRKEPLAESEESIFDRLRKKLGKGT